MAPKSIELQADALRQQLGLEPEPTHATLSRALVGKDNVPLLDAEKLRAGDTAHQAAVRALLGAGAQHVTVNTQPDDYTLELADDGAYIRTTKETATVVTVPADADVPFPIGASIVLRQAGAGQLSVAPDDGVTVNTSKTLNLAGQHATACLVKVAADEWDLTGELEPEAE